MAWRDTEVDQCHAKSRNGDGSSIALVGSLGRYPSLTHHWKNTDSDLRKVMNVWKLQLRDVRP